MSFFDDWLDSYEKTNDYIKEQLLDFMRCEDYTVEVRLKMIEKLIDSSYDWISIYEDIKQELESKLNKNPNDIYQ